MPDAIYIVRWKDARGASPHWQEAGDLTDGLCEILSVGFLVGDYPDHIVVAPHRTEEGDLAGVMYIPRGCIVQLDAVTLPERRKDGAEEDEPAPAETVSRAAQSDTSPDSAPPTAGVSETREKKSPPEELEVRMTDMVNHPPHYMSPSGLESIDVIEAFELGFCLGNAVKYILRAGKKGDAITDLRKARWYTDREIARRGGERRGGPVPPGTAFRVGERESRELRGTVEHEEIQPLPWELDEADSSGGPQQEPEWDTRTEVYLSVSELLGRGLNGHEAMVTEEAMKATLRCTEQRAAEGVLIGTRMGATTGDWYLNIQVPGERHPEMEDGSRVRLTLIEGEEALSAHRETSGGCSA